MLATRGRQDGITYIRSYTKTADNIFMWDTKMIDCKVGLSQDDEFAGDFGRLDINIRWIVVFVL